MSRFAIINILPLKFFYTFVFTFFCNLISYGQTISYSPYSAFGIGLLKERTSAYNRSMGETGIAVRDYNNLNNLNPASYTALQTVTQITEFGLFIEKSKLSTSELSQSAQLGNLTAMNFWFRGSKRWSANVGLSPYSTVNYNIVTNKNFDQTENVEVSYTGEGGLNQFYIGNGIQLTKNLSAGFNLSYIFGKIESSETILSGEYDGLVLSNKIYMNRPNIDFGIQYSFNLNNKRSFNLGMTAGDQLRLNTSKDIAVYKSTSLDSLYLDSENIKDYVIPGQLGLGIAYQTPYHTIAIDLKTKNWSQANFNSKIRYQNTKRLSIGYEFKGKQLATSWASFISYRAGAFIQNNYLVLNNKPFNEMGFTLGTGIPTGGNRGIVNLSYSYHFMGTTQKNLIYQSSKILTIDISMRDVWGIRRKFD